MTREKMDLNRLNQRGAVAIIVALLIAVFLGFAALAIDLGYLKVVRNELQNAADAAALNLASKLFPQNYDVNVTPPLWPTDSDANSAIAFNKSDAGVTLTNATAIHGYWNMARNNIVDGNGNPIPNPAGPNTSLDCPAVQVTVSKSGTINGGPVRHWFAPIIGIQKSDVSATATAAVCSPGSLFPGSNFLPLAISDYAAKNAGTDEFHITDISSALTCPNGGYCGQWTTVYDFGNQSNAVVKSLIENGLPPGTELKVNTNINIVPGNRSADYIDINTLYLAAHSKRDKDVCLPVVENVCGPPGCTSKVTSFVGFHLTASVWQGSDKYVSGYLVPGLYCGESGGINSGPNYGAYAPPVLVN